jgi:D-alanyl-lipoteichoic acid acyltransferase DltB (MBOAT superfamily)
MLFNSISFLLFLPIVFVLYWFVTNKKLRLQNFMLLSLSYFFYACWDYRFLFLLMFSTLLDYYSGIKIEEASNKRKKQIWLFISIFLNLGFLGVFKYYDFFALSFAEALSHIGFQIHPATLNIILPVGISFYTFHGLSYVIDIYYEKIKSERDFINYGLFVSFFPLLVAGPIERATHLLPQIKKERSFNYSNAVLGLRQILWGLFKKIVIADNCAVIANDIFNNYHHLSGSTLLVGAFFFTVQIYGDFSGYSDIALGTARLFGIELLRNFAFPYFSRDIAEFWRRWHISLSSWFRDYLYIPLGGSQGGKWKKIRNTFIIFLVSGFWHGANWTFIIWGFINALYFLPLLLSNKNRVNIKTVAEGKMLPTVKESFQIFTTFSLTMLAWIFFRSESVSQAIEILGKIFSSTVLSAPKSVSIVVLILVFLFFVIEWLGRANRFAIEYLLPSSSRFLRWSFYYIIIILIFLFGGQHQQFIYFQF